MGDPFRGRVPALRRQCPVDYEFGADCVCLRTRRPRATGRFVREQVVAEQAATELRVGTLSGGPRFRTLATSRGLHAYWG